MFRRKKNKKGSKSTDKYASAHGGKENGTDSPDGDPVSASTSVTASASASAPSSAASASASASISASMGNAMENPASSSSVEGNDNDNDNLNHVSPDIFLSDSGEASHSSGNKGNNPIIKIVSSSSASVSSLDKKAKTNAIGNGNGNTNETGTGAETANDSKMKKTRSTPVTKTQSAKSAKGFRAVRSGLIQSTVSGSASTSNSNSNSNTSVSTSTGTQSNNGSTMVSAQSEVTQLRDNSSKSKDEGKILRAGNFMGRANSNASNKSKNNKNVTAPASTPAPAPVPVPNAANTTSTSTTFPNKKPIQVNYDVSPTLLYKFIEYKDWTETLSRIKDAPEEARVWVYRVEDFNPEQDDDGQSILTLRGLNIRWRMLPIHVAIIFNAPIKVIMALYKAYPESIMEGDDRKMMPIHLACRVVSNVNVAQFLIFKSAESLKCLDYKGRTALDILKEYRDQKGGNGGDKESNLREKKNRESLIKLCTEKLQKINDVHVSDDDDGSDGSDDEKEFAAAFQNGGADGDDMNKKEKKEEEEEPVEKKRSFGKRFAGKRIAKSMRIQRTEPKIKEPTKEVDYDSYPTVLIKLIERKMWEQAITRCVEVPQEASTWMCRLQEVKGKKEGKDEVRWKILPIHSAIVLHAPVEVIEALVDAYPLGLQKGDDRQMLPLHMAFRLGSSPETAAVLVDAYPEALKKKDSRGHTPLHILKAYRRKYIKDRDEGKNMSDMDINRKKLIKFYLGGRRYGHSGSQDTRLRKYESDSESEEESSDEESYYDSEDEKSLFYKDMFGDFAKLASQGITSFPYIMRDTLACRGGSYDLGA